MLIEHARATAAATPGDATTERILVAALEEMQEFGLRRLTVDDVARRARVSRVTIYRRFASKEALIEAVVMHEFVDLLEELDAVMNAQAELDDRLIEGFVFVLRHTGDHALFQRLLASEPDVLLPFLTLDAAPLLNAARAFLAERLGGDEDAAEALLRLTHSFLLTRGGGIDLEDDHAVRAFARRYLTP